jgi:phosphatidylglycerol lysyltransferase
VLKHGWNTTCFQIVNPGIEYWFGGDGESVVGYVTSGKTRVVAGAPVCSETSLPAVAAAFENDARQHGLNVCYFGAEARLEGVLHTSKQHSRVLLGAQPVWHPANWPAIMAGRSSLRAQLSRARNKGVHIGEWSVEKSTHNPLLRECLEAWLQSKGLPPLHFVVEPDTLGRLDNRRIFVATCRDRVEAFLVLSPIPTRNGWLTEQFPHRPNAPNGTVELMMDFAVRSVASEGAQYVTLGLSPLSRRATIEPFDNPLWLRIVLGWMRRHGTRFYNFEGLDYFKSKLMPAEWEPVYAISNQPTFTRGTMLAIANAFTENRPFRTMGLGILRAVSVELQTFRKRLLGS